ncbi:3-hydroxyacyl-CoA dehydrogenase [Thalassobaculum sp. OXR-137]|uniref:3-hydroxyacyl-CoA dehydrogenase n=1 Tax=Thalassobaculum sp. OXR-137 TaxID=3100173 RepID=UPI002AC9D366|nr:3-hydroxyacyl-CoA dehydrogenase [Thalassobaculum sp. OXR-137]WPZ34217.1 3-hydroxyacyl-CoA dehydrogenase [Thalassobaculum sp. OXR-137]
MVDANSPDLVIGVVGCGAMGQGIIQVALQGGMKVVAHDAMDGGAKAGAEKVVGRLDRLVEKGTLEADAAAAMKDKLVVAKGVEDLAPCGVVVEAVFEDIEVKRALFTAIEGVVAEDAIIASNTSSLPIGSIARVCKNPGRIAGLHFFNPVPLMRLVEIIQGPATDDAVIEKLVTVGKRFGRTPVVVKDSPGFLVNLGGRAFTTEGLHLDHEAVATPAQVDAVMRDCGHFRMGPFQLMDLTGIDVNYPVSMIVFEQFLNDPRLRTTPLHRALAEAGRFGRKTGQGHFRYDDKGQVIDPPSPDHVTDAAPASTVAVATDGDEALAELLERAGLSVRNDDGQLPIVAALYGEDATGFAARTGTDHTRLVAVDTTGDTSKRVTLMTAPAADPAHRDAVAAAFAKAGIAPTVIQDSPGFILQRMRAMIANLGCEMAQIALATPSDIDTAMKLGLNYPKGPLEIAEEMGVKRTYEILSAIHDATQDPRYRPSLWLRRRALLGLGAHQVA